MPAVVEEVVIQLELMAAMAAQVVPAAQVLLALMAVEVALVVLDQLLVLPLLLLSDSGQAARVAAACGNRLALVQPEALALPAL